MDFKDHIRVITDFPKEGISYKDITTLLKNGEVYRAAIDALVDGDCKLNEKDWSGYARDGLFNCINVFKRRRKVGRLSRFSFSPVLSINYGYMWRRGVRQCPSRS